jgi:predicted dehydrogenase
LHPINVGIIGCGNVSSQYLNAAKFFQAFQIAALADLDLGRAAARAAEYGVGKALTVDDLLAEPEVELIINLTIPNVHAGVSRQILEAGKSVYSEKPLGTVREDAKPIWTPPRPGACASAARPTPSWVRASRRAER